MIDILSLLGKFKPRDNYRYMGAHCLTHIPRLGECAYLNTIFEPAEQGVQQQLIDPLQLPGQLRDFYRQDNGLHLLSDTLSVHGFFPRRFLYEREDLKRRYPYNVMQPYGNHSNDCPNTELFFFASYVYDRSHVVIEKKSGKVVCLYPDSIKEIRAFWPTFEQWLITEVQRLSDGFDENGIRLIPLEATLPGQLN